MKLERLERCPSWPARMTADVAALYMGVSKSTFQSRFGSMGVKEGTNHLWSKEQLDLHIARQFALPQAPRPSQPRDDSWDDVR